MKIPHILFLLLPVLARCDPTFVGFVTTKESGTLFAVVASKDSPSRWVKIGDTFEGYSVVEYRSKEEVLILKKGSQSFLLRLKDSKVSDGTAATFEAKLVAEAKKLVAKMDKWESDVTYQSGQATDGFWYVFATKLVDGHKEVRRVRLTPEGIATNYSVMKPEVVQ